MFFHERLNWCTIKFPIAESSNLGVFVRTVQYDLIWSGKKSFKTSPPSVETCAKLTYD